MASNFQSSFIPKGPITEQPFKKKKRGAAGTLALFLLAAMILAYGGLFLYKNMVKNQIEDLKIEIAEAEKNIDKETIKQMSDFSKKLSLAKLLIAKHKVASRFLDSLASSTVSAVQFTSFSYGSFKDGQLAVSLQGKATGYSSIALQENVFSKNKDFKSVEFSDLMLADKGMVSFTVDIVVDQGLSSYSLQNKI